VVAEVQVVARIAGRGDVPALVELYRRFQDALADERGGAVHLSKEAFAEPLEGHFRKILRDDRRIVALGTLEDVVVGLAVARLEQVAHSSQHATVEVLYVDPPAREVGVGEALLDAVVTWAAHNGAVGVDVLALPGMREAKNFLEGSGFVARLLVMHRRINDSGADADRHSSET